MLSKKELQFIRDLHRKKTRKEEGVFICEGEKLIKELLQSDWQIHTLYARGELANFLTQQHFNYSEISEKDLSRVSQLSTANEGLAIVESKVYDLSLRTKGLTLLLDSIQDPGNLGTIIRTAEWFGIDQIVCSEDTVDLYNAKTVQSTMGSLFRMPVVYKPLSDAIRALKKENIPLYVADMKGKSAFSYQFQTPCALLLGNESHGVSANYFDLADETLSIPSFGNAESLNVAIASSIFCALYRANV